jgi:hypothetical protein
LRLRHPFRCLFIKQRAYDSGIQIDISFQWRPSVLLSSRMSSPLSKYEFPLTSYPKEIHYGLPAQIVEQFQMGQPSLPQATDNQTLAFP